MRSLPPLAVAALALVAAFVWSALGPIGRVAVAGQPAAGPRPAPAAADVLFDMAPLARLVRPMANPLQDRLPLLAWNLPQPKGVAMVAARATGALREEIDLLAARGIVPTVDRGWDWTPEGAMAMARTLQEAGRPVYVLIPIADLMESHVYQNCPVWAEGPDGSQGGKMRKWPCLPLADTRAGAAWVREQLRSYKEAGIRVNGVFFDDESLPHPWNGVYEAQAASPACRRHYPPGVLDAFPRFLEYVQRLRVRIESEVMADPVHQMFPGAIVGNYGEYASGLTAYMDANENALPPRDVGRMDAVMPSAYANTTLLARFLKEGESMTQERADRIYLHVMLRAISTCNQNKPRGKLSIPFVSRAVRDNRDPRVAFGMSRALYREMLRHVWMRGTDGLYLFNLGSPGSGVTARASFESVEDARSTYDEMLTWREFLKAGQPLNFEYPGPAEPPLLWSGLRLGNRALVRARSMGPEAAKVKARVFPNVTLMLDAPPEGATYLITAPGRVERVTPFAAVPDPVPAAVPAAGRAPTATTGPAIVPGRR